MTVSTAVPRTRRGNGGMPARRAIVRWAWRLFRREWRQQALVLALLVVAVASSVGLAAAAYNIAPTSGRADFGTATSSFTFHDLEPSAFDAIARSAKDWFGTVEFIGSTPIDVPGSTRRIDLRAQATDGPFGRPLLALRHGRYPTDPNEVAVTDGVATMFDTALGRSVTMNGTVRTVVGVVEDPSRLDDDFALVTPSAIGSSSTVRLLVAGSSDRVRSFRPPGQTNRELQMGGGASIDVVAALAVLAASTVVLMLVALVAAASFIVIAQRRLRQLGMIGAVGASEKHLRMVMLANGAVSGAVAASLGTVLGLGGWVLTAPHLESAVNARIDALHLPVWLVPVAIALAVVVATGACWWPARTLARIPTVQALSGRPGRAASARRSALLAVVLVVGGMGALIAVGDASGDRAVPLSSALAIIGGLVATVVGVLMLSPFVIRGFARLAPRLPVGPRLALRDLGRASSRAGAALAAVSLALGIPVAIVVVSAASTHGASAGNLSDRQLIVRVAVPGGGPFVPLAEAADAVRPRIASIATAAGAVSTVELVAAADPQNAVAPSPELRQVLSIGLPVDHGYRETGIVYVASDDLLKSYGLRLATIDPGTAYLSSTAGELRLLGSGSREARVDPIAIDHVETLRAAYTALPHSFVTPTELSRNGWIAVPSGAWLVETQDPITSAQLSAARRAAAAVGLTVESRDHQHGLATLRTGATAVGMLLALAILAMTVGLMRTDAEGETRTLTATGATRSTRRALTATTSGTLALLGVLLGSGGAYGILLARRVEHVDELGSVPVIPLAVLLVGTPLVAAVAGWLVVGGEPEQLGRQPGV